MWLANAMHYSRLGPVLKKKNATKDVDLQMRKDEILMTDLKNCQCYLWKLITYQMHK
jgi:hypothetical protein